MSTWKLEFSDDGDGLEPCGCQAYVGEEAFTRLAGTLTHSLSQFTTGTDRFNKAPATATGFPYIAERLQLPEQRDFHYPEENISARYLRLQFHICNYRILPTPKEDNRSFTGKRASLEMIERICDNFAALLGRVQISKEYGKKLLAHPSVCPSSCIVGRERWIHSTSTIPAAFVKYRQCGSDAVCQLMNCSLFATDVAARGPPAVRAVQHSLTPLECIDLGVRFDSERCSMRRPCVSVVSISPVAGSSRSSSRLLQFFSGSHAPVSDFLFGLPYRSKRSILA
ncbi:hypothetical protein WN51_09271 [Melipona quadrifasciata]|uniref:Uncharacterized protein n=1 Tax=Melipona quadrifasciata TaxID=166423 RepID=A0A0M9A6S2_9HYME|nr:hypothetical protein WN51_09271 [Melipona quadrifasciata]